MRIQVELPERFYRIFERGVVALESINKTLQPAPEDFTEEDQAVNKAAHDIAEAKERIPHGTQTTN